MSDAPTPSRLVIFDVCDTLYSVNTTMDFIGFYGRQENSRRIGHILRRWLSRRSPFFYLGAVALRLLDWDIAKERIIAFLAGEERSRLNEAVSQYVRDILPSAKNHELHERLKSHQANGDRIILVSSSLDLVVAQIADQLGLEYRASILEFANDRCTGRLSLDLTGRKAGQLRELAGIGSTIWVYTDNRSDKDLISIADRATIVLPRGQGHDRWAGDEHEYVAL